MKTYAKVVFVDSKDKKTVPKIYKKLLAAGGSMPLLIFESADGEQSYGSFNHASLKGQDYSKIFRDTKKKIREAKKTGELSDAGASATSEEDEEVSEQSDSDAIVIANPSLRKWKSSKGKEISAKLVKFENGIYHLKTSRGKDISVTAADLDSTSVAIAEEIVEINTN